MARENRNIILRFCWLVGWGWVGLERERWRLRFFGEDCQEILMSKPYNYRLARPLTPPLFAVHLPLLCTPNSYRFPQLAQILLVFF